MTRWPAEWESHSAIWLSWPHNRETWPGRFENVPTAFARFVRAIAEVTPVKLLAQASLVGKVRRHLSAVRNLDLFDIPTNDCWIRDYGPTFVIDDAGGLQGVDWRYNAWGEKYSPWDDDAAAATRLLEHSHIQRVDGELCLEGGAIETNGDGVLLTTPECILTSTRNPGLTREQAEAKLRTKLGIREVVWLDGGGIEGDDTDGHIDQLARFVSRDKIICASCDDSHDANFVPLEENFRQLCDWASLRNCTVTKLPLPPARYVGDQRVPECYCNFLITNELMLVPLFNDAVADDQALGILRDLCPQYHVVGLNASDLAWGLGAFHCASQQQPGVSRE